MLNERDLFDRHLRTVFREKEELEQRRFTVVKLEEPIQRGWRRHHVLSELAQNRKDRQLLEEILEVVGTVIYRPDRHFLKRRRRSKKLVEIEQPLRDIRDWEWSWKRYPSAWKPYFHLELRPCFRRRPEVIWTFAQPSLFTLKI